MSFLPGVFERNWQLKALALGLAVLLWTVPRFEEQGSQTLEDVPIRVQLSDATWVQMGEASPPSVSVTLSGPARDLIAIGVEKPPILVPIDEVLSSDTTVRLLPSWFRGYGRDGVVVEGLSPGVVSLSFEPIEERRLPFSVPLSGELPRGLSRAGAPRISPSEATVFGPPSRFQGIDSLRLLPLDLSRVQGEGPLLQSVDTAAIRGLDILPVEVSVVIPTDSTVTREFPEMELVLPRLESDPQLQTTRSTVTVFLTGAASLVEGLDERDLRATISTGRASLAPGEETQVVVVVEGLPAWVEATVEPDWVLLRRPVGQ